MAEPFVRELSAPRWRGGGYKDNVRDNPSWNDIEDAIRALNGEDLNDLYLEGPTLARMVVGGGEGHYIVSVDVPDDQEIVKHFSAVNPEADPDETINLCVAGTYSDWPTNELVDLDVALTVARAYYRDGTLAPSTQWKRV